MCKADRRAAFTGGVVAALMEEKKEADYKVLAGTRFKFVPVVVEAQTGRLGLTTVLGLARVLRTRGGV